MRHAPWLTAAVLLTGSTAFAASSPPASPPPASSPVAALEDSLKGLTAQQACERVLSALKERDAKLANVRYVVRQHSFNVDDQGGHKDWDDKVVEVRRHAKGHWMLQARFKAGQADPYWEQITNIRPGENRIFTRDREKGTAVATPHAGGEAMTFRSFWFNQIVGFRAVDDGPPRTVVGWIEDAARTPPQTVTCTTGVHQDRAVVAVAVYDGSQQTNTFYLDPARGWMTVRIDSFGGTVRHNTWSAMEVEKAELVDGVWFPVEVLCRSGTTGLPGPAEVTEIHYTTEAATVGKVNEADLEVPKARQMSGKE